MINELIRRRRYCVSQEIDKFHNHLPRNPNVDCNYSWDITPEGCFIHGRSSVTYLRYTDGHCFRLVRWFHIDDCEMMKDIYNLSLETEQFRSEQLLTYEIVQHNDEQYLYYETRRPNNEFGLTGIEEAMITPTEEFFTKFVDQVTILLPHMDAMSRKYGLGPSLTNLQITSSRALDSKGHYWKNLKIFKYPTNQIIEQSLEMLSRSIFYIQNAKHEQSIVPHIVQYASESWTLA